MKYIFYFKTSLFVIMLVVMKGTGVSAQGFSSGGKIAEEFIFDKAPHLQCHASTIVETNDGLVAAWFGGTKEGNPDVGIWLSRCLKGKWTIPVEVANGAETEIPRRNALNPVLFQWPDGPLALIYHTGDWWTYIKESRDNGATWSKPKRMANGSYGPIKNKPVLLADGSVICPSSTEFTNGEGNLVWRVHFERTVDSGKSWQFIGPVNEGLEIQAIQPGILIHSDSVLQAVGRTRQGRLFDIWSGNGGKTWGKMGLLDLPNNNSGTDAVTLKDGRFLLVYNHIGNREGFSSGYRSPINLALSGDGKNWNAVMILEHDPRKEFSYPAIIQAKDGLVHILYTWKREKIKHVVIDPSKIESKPFSNGTWPY